MASSSLSTTVNERLAPWKAVVVLWVRSDWPELTNRQLALLMIVCLEPGRHPVRALAARLDVPKPIISRVLDRLFDLGLIIRETDRRDRRNVFAVATPQAITFLGSLDDFLRAGTSPSPRLAE